MKTQDLIAEFISLPVEERAIVVDSLSKSLNPPESEIDKEWVIVAKRRLEQMRSGEVQPIAGEEVFQRIFQYNLSSKNRGDFLITRLFYSIYL